MRWWPSSCLHYLFIWWCCLVDRFVASPSLCNSAVKRRLLLCVYANAPFDLSLSLFFFFRRERSYCLTQWLYYYVNTLWHDVEKSERDFEELFCARLQARNLVYRHSIFFYKFSRLCYFNGSSFNKNELWIIID